MHTTTTTADERASPEHKRKRQREKKKGPKSNHLSLLETNEFPRPSLIIKLDSVRRREERE